MITWICSVVSDPDDQEFLIELYEEFHALMFSVARRYNNNWMSCEDIVQESILRIMDKLDVLRSKKRCVPELFGRIMRKPELRKNDEGRARHRLLRMSCKFRLSVFLNKRAASFSRQLKSVRQDVLLPLPTSCKVHQSAAFFRQLFRKVRKPFCNLKRYRALQALH